MTVDSTPFTLDDLEVLMEAMEAWENKDFGGDLMADVVTALLVKKSDPEYDRINHEREVQKAQAATEKATRKERSILLRAKIVGLKDAARAAALIGGGRS